MITMALSETQRAKTAEAALKILETQGWSGLSLPAVAAAAGLKLADFYPARGVERVLAWIDQGLDRAATARVDPALSPRDRLFEAVMARFDAMEARRPAHRALEAGIEHDVDHQLQRGARRLRTAAWLLAACGINASGFSGAARAAAFAHALALAQEGWRADEDGGLAKTMAALDAGLRRMERWGLLPNAAPPETPAPQHPAADAEKSG
jgi:ubiquinone biosynthesis protein COQ9